MRAGANAVYRWLAVLILAAIVVQFFLAGYGVFGGRTSDTSRRSSPRSRRSTPTVRSAT